MTDSVSIDPDVLRAAAPRFGAAAFELHTSLAFLPGTLGWGSDQQGRDFAAQFVPHHDELVRALSTLAAGLASIDDGLRAFALNLAGSDEASVVNAE